MTKPFPKSPTFMTIDEPFRFEGDLFDLEVEGEIPARWTARSIAWVRTRRFRQRWAMPIPSTATAW